MKVLIDACVLYPTVMREMVLGVAEQGLFTPLWSPRIIGEWAHAAARLGAEHAETARAEIALLRAKWPDSDVDYDAVLEQGLHLPDVNDRHVLAAAIAGGAQTLLTMNLRDFPTNILASHHILRRDPDGLLCEYLATDKDAVCAVARAVHATAERLSGQTLGMRPLMKKARLPRLGKALERL